jgi:hypothetical protein
VQRQGQLPALYRLHSAWARPESARRWGPQKIRQIASDAIFVGLCREQDYNNRAHRVDLCLRNENVALCPVARTLNRAK